MKKNPTVITCIPTVITCIQYFTGDLFNVNRKERIKMHKNRKGGNKAIIFCR